jgi:WD40 repeat protein
MVLWAWAGSVALLLGMLAVEAAEPAKVPEVANPVVLKGHTERVMSLAFSPDGRMILSGSQDRTIRLWGVGSGLELARLEGHTGLVRCVVFSREGTRALSGGYDSTLRWWDVEAARELRQLRGHGGDVNAVALSPDERRALSGGDDVTLRLWDLHTGAELRCLRGHTERIYSIAFCPGDGTRSPAAPTARRGSGTWSRARRCAACAATSRASWPWRSPQTAAGS